MGLNETILKKIKTECGTNDRLFDFMINALMFESEDKIGAESFYERKLQEAVEEGEEK